MFLNCPLNNSLNHIEMWFINLWNHFIIPYLTATTLDGIKVWEYNSQFHNDLDYCSNMEWTLK